MVRSYNMAGLSPAVLETARTTATAILLEARIEAEWRDCLVGCVEPLDARELLVRIVAAPKTVPPETLGCSMVDVRERAGALATIYADRVETLAARTGVDVGRLIGRALAHEIGHMLLGTSHHGAEGLMRARWLDRELQNDEPLDWTWSHTEIDEIHHRLAERLHEAVEPVGLLAAAVISIAPLMPAPMTCHMGKCVSK